jgi:hypothetical protein
MFEGADFFGKLCLEVADGFRDSGLQNFVLGSISEIYGRQTGSPLRTNSVIIHVKIVPFRNAYEFSLNKLN